MAHSQPRIVIRNEAHSDDIPSLCTIVPRAFHPTLEFHRKVFPDTPSLREWWRNIFADEISDPKGHVITAVDSHAIESSRQAVGVICMRLFNADDQGAGLWTMYPYTSDHDMTLFQPAVDAIVKYRSEIFAGTGQKHYLVELFGVDHAYQGSGSGSMLLRRACEIADEQGYPVFVEANMNAYRFYERFGFVVKDKVPVKMPEGQEDFWEDLLVRPGREKSSIE